MLTIKIYLAPSGRVADLKKDFPIYQGQYNNILLNVFVPTSILAPNFTVLSTANNSVDSPFVSGTAVEIASRTIERNGKYKLSKTFYMRYVKTLVKEGTEYALFERKLPKEFVFYAGAGINAPEMILNVVNVNFGEISSATAVSSNATLQVSVNLPNTVLPITQDYVFEYGKQNKWYLNGYEVNIEEEYGITYTGTAVQGNTITLSVVASKPTTIQTVTSQTVKYDVMPSTDIDQEPSLETGEIETIEAYLNALKSVLDAKQDKIDYGLTTSQKSVVGAINALASFITNNNNSIALINQVLSALQNDVNALKNVVATGEDYLGTYTYQASTENDLPTDNQLLTYAKSVRGSNYELKNGDVILVVQLLTNIPAKRYKYIYNESESKWDYFEIQPVEMAQNGTAGIVYGTWGTGDTNHTLIDINNGKISHIFIEETENNYVDLHEFVLQNKNTLNNIITGITSVGLSQMALKDGLGNVIDTTYLTKEVGATQQFVKDYALPKQFNDTYYLGKDTETNEFVFATTLKSTAIQVSTTLGDNEIFTAKSTATYEFDLNGRNGQTMRLVCSLSLTENAQIRVTTSINNRVIGVSLTPLNLTNELQVFEVRSNYDLLGEGEEIKVNIGDQITQKVELVRTSSATAQFEVISLSSTPTTLGYLLDYQSVVSAKVLQSTGASVEDVMSQNAVTEFGTPQNVNFTESETRVTYDTEDGIKMVSVAEDIRANGDVVNYTTELTIPLEVEGDLSIDAVENGTKIAIAGASKLLLTLVTPQQTTGTLTEEQLAFLQAKDSNYIEIDDGEGHRERYIYSTDATTNGYRVYAHIEDEPNLIIKSFTIILSVRSWTIQSYDITELLNGKLDKVTTTGQDKVYMCDSNGNQTTKVISSPYYIFSYSAIPVYCNATDTPNNVTDNPMLLISPATPTKPYHAANKLYVDDGLSGKVDKVTEATQFHQLYGKTNAGVQKMYNVSHYNYAGNVPVYEKATQAIVGSQDDGGTIAVSIPLNPYQATPKKWVEDNFTVYKHIVRFRVYDNMFIDGNFIIYSSQSTPFTSERLPNGVYAGWCDDGYNFLISNRDGSIVATKLFGDVQNIRYLLDDDLFVDSDTVTKL